jgi:hypothetical protein
MRYDFAVRFGKSLHANIRAAKSSTSSTTLDCEVVMRSATRTLGLALVIVSGFSLTALAADTPAATDAKAPADAKPHATEGFAVRVRAGSDQPYKDSKGNKWLGDVESKEGGFVGGSTIERPDLKIENTKDPDIYRAEHYSMDSFWWPVPNGKYTVKLHFCETFEGIGGLGDRVFGFKIGDKEFKNFDIWKLTGGAQRPRIETVDVTVTDGKLKVTFVPKIENPQINGIEILSADKASEEQSSGATKSTSP